MANSPIPILSILIWLPIVTGLCLFLLPDRRSQFARIGAVIMSLIMLLLCIPLYQGYSPDAGLMQFQEQHTFAQKLLNLN